MDITSVDMPGLLTGGFSTFLHTSAGEPKLGL